MQDCESWKRADGFDPRCLRRLPINAWRTIFVCELKKCGSEVVGLWWKWTLDVILVFRLFVYFLDSVEKFPMIERGQDIQENSPVNSLNFIYLCVLSIVCFCRRDLKFNQKYICVFFLFSHTFFIFASHNFIRNFLSTSK